MTNDEEQEKQHELDEVEEKLKREHEESKKPAMGVSGRSVFEIKRIKERPQDTSNRP